MFDMLKPKQEQEAKRQRGGRNLKGDKKETLCSKPLVPKLRTEKEYLSMLVNKLAEYAKAVKR